MTDLPPMPSLAESQRSRYLSTGIYAALGADGDGYLVARKGKGSGYSKNSDRFPLTDYGWRQAWEAFQSLDPAAAGRYAKAVATPSPSYVRPNLPAGTLRQTDDGVWWASVGDGSWKPAEGQLTQAPDGKWWSKQEDGSLREVDAPAVQQRTRSKRPAPGTGVVWAVSLLFGVFGVIPAAIQANAARQDGHPTGPYWAAFWVPMIIATIVWIVVIVSIANSADSSTVNDCLTYSTC